MAGRWFKTLALWCVGAFFSVAAHAQGSLLFITTQDDPLPPPGVTDGGGGGVAIYNAREAFKKEAQDRGLTFEDATNELSGATSIATELQNASMVVLITIYGPANAARMAEVEAALKTRPDLAVLAFVDGCCSQTENINTFVPYVNAIKPWGTAVTTAYTADRVTAPLNTASLYQASFAGAAPLVGGWYSSLGGVPPEYTLYNDPRNAGTAYGLFVPQAASNSGQGACLFMISDASPFADGFGTQPNQSNAIAAAFAGAALDPAGACKQPAAGVPDVAVALTGPATLTPSTSATYTLTVSNPGVVASTATTVTVTLPAGVTVTGALHPACTAGAGGTSVTCNVGVLTAANPTAPQPVAGGREGFAIQLVAAPGAAGGNASAVVPNQTGEVNTVNNSTALPIAVGAVPVAVPTLDVWALLTLAGLLPLVAARRRRQG